MNALRELSLNNHQIDELIIAFLNIKLNEGMYIKLASGIELCSKCNCFMLVRSLYELKQSPR